MAASGPSLTPAVAELCRGHPIVAVQDAYRLLPFAEVLYGCDSAWWELQYTHPPYVAAMRSFAGEKWSSHGGNNHNNKITVSEKYGINLVQGKQEDGFSFDHAAIHYGSNSGFQALNLALLFGARRVILVGFDMRRVGRQSHFFGDHPPQLRNGTDYGKFVSAFARAAKHLPPGIEIVNATPGSALRCFPMRKLEDVI